MSNPTSNDPSDTETLRRLLCEVEAIACKLRYFDEDLLSVGKQRLCELLLGKLPTKDERYILTCVKNAMIDAIRYAMVRRELRLPHDVVGPNDGLAAVDVRDLLSILPKQIRQAFDLHCMQDFTLQDTALQLGLSVRSVSILIARAKRRLERELK